MRPAPGSALAEEHLSRARNAVEVGDFTAAVQWANLCAEVAVECIAAKHDIDSRRDHFRRASAARRLHETKVLDKDLAELLIRLNNERKHATYEGLQPDLRGRSWQDVLDSLSALVAAAAGSAPGDEPGATP